uniref:HSF-type DNA-binding domain-containing protein n=1 Tax=Anopheles dirus TaxID=7168 RepID=A0A182NHN6_9DIPT
MELPCKIESDEMEWQLLPYEAVENFRFELKLWLATICDEIDYLRWNRDQTVLVVNVASMEKSWRTEPVSMFLCRRVSDFLWLLHHSGFEACAVERLDKSERNALGSDCLYYVHPQFIGSNVDIFTAWIADAFGRVHANGGGSCTVPRAGFRRRRQMNEFSSTMSKLMLEMKLVEANLREKVAHGAPVPIPPRYEDMGVLDTPSYAVAKEIAGYYGAVSASDVSECLGSLIPVYYDGSEEETNVTEEIKREEPDWQEVSKNIAIVGNVGNVESEAEAVRYVDHVEKLYEGIDIFDIATLDSCKKEDVEIHEIYEISDDNVELEVTVEPKEENSDTLPYSLGEAASAQAAGNMPDYLTQSVKALITPLDID